MEWWENGDIFESLEMMVDVMAAINAMPSHEDLVDESTCLEVHDS
jgi:hypothetical protein